MTMQAGLQTTERNQAAGTAEFLTFTLADETYVTLDGQRIEVQRRGPTRMKVTAGPHTIAAAMVPRTRVTGAESVYNAPARSPGAG